MSKLLMRDKNGEPWLDNPFLITANPRGKRKRGRTMARRGRSNPPIGLAYLQYPKSRYSHKKGVIREHGPEYYFGRSKRKQIARRKRAKFRKVVGAYMARRKSRVTRKRYSRRFAGASSRTFARKFRRRRVYRGTLKAGRKRGRIRFMFNKRRHYRHNPGHLMQRGISLPFGLSLPSLSDVAFGMAGLVAPPRITAILMGYVPASFRSSAAVTWIVKIASVVVPGMLIRKYYDARAGYAYMVGGAASLAIDALRTFAPSVAAQVGLGFQPMLGYYSAGQLAAGRRRMGAYGRTPGRSEMQPAITSGVPDRLTPSGRF